MSALLAAICAVLVFATAWELLGWRGERVGERARRRGTRLLRLPVVSVGAGELTASASRRIDRAALNERIAPGHVVAAKLASAVLALPLAATVAPVAPGRLGALVLVGVPITAFLVPDLLLLRIARSRQAKLTRALPDALDLMATGAASGRGAGRLIGEAMLASRGPLREELARTAAAIECGNSQEAALRELQARASGGSLSSLAAALERSRRHGSPLSAALHEQAGGLRIEQRRDIAERAARAAPKMQLAVALLLVPSVLLMVAAAIVANTGSLLPSF